ncbi:MAG TPA: hypothetical protein VFN03_00790 [Trueperaceae bacterium]|nr:hypothetical protein [Trueperaceae bacterium]
MAALVASVVIALAACGQAPSITIALDAASADLLRGSNVQVEVTLTRLGGASADVTLAVTGLPANVDASFSPAALTGGTLTSTLTLSATAAAAEGDYDISVTGTGTGLSATAPLTLEVVSLTVTGRILSILEFPVPNVAVGSQGDTDVTDSTGSFSITGLSVPYDLSVWSTVDNWVHVYEGFTADELLLAPAVALSPPGVTMATTLTGTLSGGVIPVGTDQQVTVCVEGLDGAVVGCDLVAPTESSYSIAAQWATSTTRQVRVHALQIEYDADGLPVSYPGYATTTTTLTNAVAAVANLDLGTSLPTTTVDVDIDSTVAITATFGAVQLGTNMTMPVGAVTSPLTSHEVLMPVVNAAPYTFIGLASIQQFGWQADVTGPTATVVVPDAPVLVSPANAATGVTNTTAFTAANPTDGPVTFLWQTTGGPSLAVTTMETSHPMPDPAPYGMAIPAAANGSWQVVGSSGPTPEHGSGVIGDMYNAIYLFIFGSSPGLEGSGTFAISNSNTFTTAP